MSELLFAAIPGGTVAVALILWKAVCRRQTLREERQASLLAKAIRQGI